MALKEITEKEKAALQQAYEFVEAYVDYYCDQVANPETDAHRMNGCTIAESNAAYNAAMEMGKLKDEQNTEFLVRIKNAFEGMEQMCDKLTSGNVAHQRPHLKGYARGWVAIIEEYLKKGENEI